MKSNKNLEKLVILDRDGVINYDSKEYIKSTLEWKAIRSSMYGISKLSRKGVKIAIASNQSGIGRGLFSESTLNDIHKKLIKYVDKYYGKIDLIRTCPHLPSDNCSCRKPKPGLLISILEYYNTDPESVYFVGDSLKDIQAAKAAKIKACLVLTGNGKETLKEEEVKNDVLIFKNLNEFSNFYIKNELN